MAILSAFTALLLLLCCLASSYLLAIGLGLRRSGSPRACATLALAYGLLITLFELLTGWRAFHVWVALALWLLLTALLLVRWRTRAAAGLRWDLGRARALGRSLLKDGRRWLLPGALLIVGARLLRGLAAPPLVWDSLTYHLVKAGRWVQTGADDVLLAPDAWSYYQFFLPYGDALWAWAMLPAHGDDFLSPAGLLVWSSVLVAAYGTARVLGARRRMALPAALVTAFLPAAVVSLTSALVDNTVLALFLLSMALLLATLRSGRGGEGVAAAAALGVLAGIKPSGLPVFCLGGVVLGWVAARTWHSRGDFRKALWLMALTLLLGLLPYLQVWALKGSPLYPWPLSIGGVQLSEGNTQLAAIDSGVLHGNPQVSVREVVLSLLRSQFMTGSDHQGLGPALLLAPVGLLAAARAWRRRSWGSLLLTVCGLSTLLGVRSKVLWSVWYDTTPRFLLPMMATLLLLAATLEAPRLRLTLWSCFAVELVLALPCGWSQVDVQGVLRVAPPVLLALAGGAVAVWLGLRKHRLVLGAAVAVALLAVSWLPVASTRGSLRYDFYSAAWQRKTFDIYPLSGKYASSWPIWKELDGERPKRLAVTAGWNGSGHNWYWYPLMGSRLQNTLTYVPVLPDGTVGDYAQKETLLQADFQTWMARLWEEEVDFVVTLVPPPLESQWMSKHPARFEPIVTSMNRAAAAWRVLPPPPM